MVKCPVKNENGVKCRHDLVECLRSGIHFGTRRYGVRRSMSELAQWRLDITKEALRPEWQGKILAELRRLDYACKYAAEDRNPYRYEKARADRRLVAQFVVRTRRHPSGVVQRLRPGTALPITQQSLDEELKP